MDKQQKFWLIELLAYWEGGVNTTSLSAYTKHSRGQTQKDIHEYQAKLGNTLTYCSSKKLSLPAGAFNTQLISGDVDEYLNWLQDPNIMPIFAEEGQKRISHESMVYPARDIAPNIVRTLVIGIKEKRYVDVRYKSMKNPDGARRIIAPHTLVNTGLRWHVRAWCENNSGFRDLVLNRFTNDMDLLEHTDVSAKDDQAWNTTVTLKFRADQRLTDAKKRILENDYNMVGGEFWVTTRGCLVEYQLKVLQVNPKILDGNPDAQQLVLANLDDIKPWLF